MRWLWEDMNLRSRRVGCEEKVSGVGGLYTLFCERLGTFWNFYRFLEFLFHLQPCNKILGLFTSVWIYRLILGNNGNSWSIQLLPATDTKHL